MNEKVNLVSEEILSDNWYTLRKFTFDYQLADGSWERQSREAYDRGNGATILLYNKEKQINSHDHIANVFHIVHNFLLQWYSEKTNYK